jgi:hypothetical protein
MVRRRSVSIRRSTDDAITRVHPRKSCATQVPFLCSISEPFLRPNLGLGWRRGLDGGEHGARLRPVGARLILHATAEVFLTDHQRPPNARLELTRFGGHLSP